MITSEYELIERAQAGDTQAFCQLAKGYERRIYLLALHYCRNRHDAEDLSQEVWLKAYQAIGRFRREASFYTWLRQITINSFLNYKRGLNTTAVEMGARMEELDATHVEGAPEDDLDQKILVERVMRALGELTPQQRLMFLLKHREGMTYEEISQALNCSTGTIKKSLYRAVAKLRQHLGLKTGSEDFVVSPAATASDGLGGR